MANSDKNILITPNVGAATGTLPTIRFTGADNTPITMRVLDNGTLSFEATAGQLFSISDGLTGSIFSVNDISGIPSIEVTDAGLVKLAQYNGKAVIGGSAASGTAELTVYPSAAANVGLSVRSFSGQSGNLQEWQGSTGTALLAINSSGSIITPATNATSTNSTGITIQTGNATGTTSTAGSIVIDSGTGTTAAGSITIGGTNASGVTIGRNSGTTTIAAPTVTLSNATTLNINGANPSIATSQTTGTSNILTGFNGTINVGSSTSTVTIGNTLSSTGAILAPAATASIPSIRLPHTATIPTSPTNGDMWTTTSGLFVRINGATVGPLGTGGGGGSGTVTSIATGTGLTGGNPTAITTTGTIAIDTTVVPRLGSANTFTGAITANSFIPSSSTVPTNGMYLSAANTLNFATNTTNRLTINSSGNATFTGQIISTSANNTADGAGQIYLNGATGNRIDFVNAGYGAPTTITRSVGTKIVLSPNITTTSVDFAIGMDTNEIWFSVPTNSQSFRWYGGTTGTTNIATLSGSGALTLSSTISASGLSGSLLSSTSGSSLGTAASGSSDIPARSDHVHSSTINNIVLTGTVNAGGGNGTNGQILQSTGTGVQWSGLLSDSTIFIVDSTDNTKRLAFDITGTTGITGTFQTTFTTAKTIIFPDNAGTVALGSDTHFIGTTSVALNRASANLALTGISSIEMPGSTSGTITIQPTATAGTNTITLPASTGTVALTSDIYTLSQTLRSVTGATDSPTSTDTGKLITIDTTTGAVTITINSSLGLSAGQKIDFAWIGAATSVTFAASSTTLNGTPGLKLRARYSAASLICLSSNTYLLVGDLSA